MTSSTPGPSKESLRKKVKRLEREQRRLRNTVSFQLGLHLTAAVQRPWRLIVLPFTFPLLVMKLGLQRLGRYPMVYTESVAVEEVVERHHSIVLFPTNGVGFGHFTRMYAIARALRKADPDLEIVFYAYAYTSCSLQRTVPDLPSCRALYAQGHELNTLERVGGRLAPFGV